MVRSDLFVVGSARALAAGLVGAFHTLLARSQYVMIHLILVCFFLTARRVNYASIDAHIRSVVFFSIRPHLIQCGMLEMSKKSNGNLLLTEEKNHGPQDKYNDA